MKNLPDWVKSRHFSCSTHLCLSMGLIAMLLTAFLPLQAQITKQWDKTIGGSSNEQLSAIQQTSDGGYILAGISESGISGDKTQANKGGADYWVVKLDAAGNKLWDKTYGTDQYDILTSLKRTPDGGYILGGYTAAGISGDKTEASKGGTDYWLVKLDANGNKLWDKTIGGSDTDQLLAIDVSNVGDLYLAGWSFSGISGDKTQGSRGGSDYWLVVLDETGNILWDKTMGGSANDQPFDIDEIPNQDMVALGGRTFSSSSGEKAGPSRGKADFWALLLENTGSDPWDISWNKTFGGNEDDILYSLQQTFDDGYILGGYSASGISGEKTQANKGICDFNPNCTGDYWVVKVDEFGEKEWDKTFGGSGNDELRVVRQMPDGGYLLAGWSNSGAGGDKTDANAGFWIVKIDAAGNKELDETFSKGDLLTSLQLTGDGGFIIGGRSSFGIVDDKTEANKGGHDFWVVKLAPIPAPGQLVSFTLINANNEQPIKVISPGEVIDLATLPSRNLNIRFDINPVGVGSVDYALTGTVRRVKWDNTAPFSLFGDDAGNYNKWITPVGSYSLTATPYSGIDKTGTAGTPLTINFTVIDQATGQYTLTITPPTNGTVSKSPDQASYAPGSTVQLTANPAAGYVFAGWTGDASGTTNPLSVVMNSNKTIGATFSPVSPTQYTLTITPTTNGTVSKNPDQASYASGSTVQLTANPAAGYVFSGWTGDASGTTNPINVVMNSNKTIGANFSTAPAGQQVTGFTLINTNNETVIQALTDGHVLNLATLPSRNLNIRIDTNPAVVGSVGYALTGTVRRIKWDNTAPYALFGDDAGNYNKWVTPVGSYTLTATPYSGIDKTGTAGTPLTISFTVIDQATTAAARLTLQPDRIGLARQLTLYPNPTDGRLQVRLAEQLQGSIRYSLLSSTGTRLAAGTLNLESPTDLLDFDFSRQLQAAGLYYLKLEGAKGQQTFKILRR